MKKWSFLVLVIGIALLGAGVWYYTYDHTHDIGSISVVMCPECKQVFLQEIGKGADGTVDCAIYDIGKEVGAALATVHANVMTDDETNPAYGTSYKKSGLMHDKFCVVNDATVVTGSYNPTDGGEKNRNNLLVIQSTTLADNYEKEYTSMATGFIRPSIVNQFWINDTKVENYFCPNDHCEEQVLRVLATAQHEVLFMTYSFTSDPIGELLSDKRSDGVTVAGVCDGTQDGTEYSECERLNALTWHGDALLHHKVFIIDRDTVITGSYNPTASGDRSNRENILIIHSPAIAAIYYAEYQAVLAQSS